MLTIQSTIFCGGENDMIIFVFSFFCAAFFCGKKGRHKGHTADQTISFRALHSNGLGTTLSCVDPIFILSLQVLSLRFAGDICLAFSLTARFLLPALYFFLAGHIAYVVAFFITAGITTGTWVSLVVVPVVSIFIFTRLRSHLGSMGGPVIAYIAIISIMVVGAASLAARQDYSLQGRALVMAGALLFYVSDLFVARHRFVKKSIVNRYAGLPMYYVAQFMLAFSVGMIP